MVLWRPTRSSKKDIKKRCLFQHRGLKCENRESRDTWTNKTVWPWTTKWSRAKANSFAKRMHWSYIMVAKLINYKLGSAGGHLCHHTGRNIWWSLKRRKQKCRVLMIFYLRTWTQPCLQPTYIMYVPVIWVNQVSFMLNLVWISICHLQLKEH